MTNDEDGDGGGAGGLASETDTVFDSLLRLLDCQYSPLVATAAPMTSNVGDGGGGRQRRLLPMPPAEYISVAAELCVDNVHWALGGHAAASLPRLHSICHSHSSHHSQTNLVKGFFGGSVRMQRKSMILSQITESDLTPRQRRSQSSPPQCGGVGYNGGGGGNGARSSSRSGSPGERAADGQHGSRGGLIAIRQVRPKAPRQRPQYAVPDVDSDTSPEDEEDDQHLQQNNCAGDGDFMRWRAHDGQESPDRGRGAGGRLLCDVLDHATGNVLATDQLIAINMMRSSWCTELKVDIRRFDICDCDPNTSWRYRTLLGVVNSAAAAAAEALSEEDEGEDGDDGSDGFDTADESETRALPPPIIALTVQYTPSSELTNVVRAVMRPVQVVYSPAVVFALVHFFDITMENWERTQEKLSRKLSLAVSAVRAHQPTYCPVYAMQLAESFDYTCCHDIERTGDAGKPLGAVRGHRRANLHRAGEPTRRREFCGGGRPRPHGCGRAARRQRDVPCRRRHRRVH